jgi:hypothetical protein
MPYQRIIGLGLPLEPMILAELNREAKLWFWAPLTRRMLLWTCGLVRLEVTLSPRSVGTRGLASRRRDRCSRYPEGHFAVGRGSAN